MTDTTGPVAGPATEPVDFALASAVAPCGAGRFRADVAPDWTQGRTAFGGLIAAQAVNALLADLPTDRPLRTVDTAFLAPVRPGRVDLAVQHLRSGRHASVLAVDLTQGEALVARVQALCASDRASAIVVEPDPPAPTLPREQGVLMPFVPGLTPAFTAHLEYWWTEGGFPYSATESGRLGGFFRFRTPQRGPAALVALADAWPVPVLAAARGPAPASSIRWSLHLTGVPAPAHDWLWFDYRTVVARHGYATCVGRLYAQERLLAWSEQSVAVFDRP